MRRVARDRLVLFTFDPDCRVAWILDYWPQLASLDAAIMPKLSLYDEVLGPVEIVPVLIPADCTDGFLYAYWRRPHAYLDPEVRAAISSFWKIDGAQEGFDRLAADLASGKWQARYGDLLKQDSIDAGYRLVIAPPR